MAVLSNYAAQFELIFFFLYILIYNEKIEEDM